MCNRHCSASRHMLSDSLLASLKYALSSDSAIKLSSLQQMSWKRWCVCSAAHNPEPVETFAGQPMIKVLFQVIAIHQDGLIAEMWPIYSEVCGLLKWKTFVLAFCLGWYPSYRWSVFAGNWVNIMIFTRGKPSPTQAVALFKFPSRRCVHKQLHINLLFISIWNGVGGKMNRITWNILASCLAKSRLKF